MHALQKYGLIGLTPAAAHCVIRDAIEDAPNQKEFSQQVVRDLTGEHSYQAKCTAHARMMAKYAVQAIANHKPFSLEDTQVKIDTWCAKNKFVEIEPESTYVPVAEQVRLGKVSAVTKTGRERGKKGEKQTKAIELFKANPTMTGAELTRLFEKELGMTTTGARTYAYNVRKVWV